MQVCSICIVKTGCSCNTPKVHLVHNEITSVLVKNVFNEHTCDLWDHVCPLIYCFNCAGCIDTKFIYWHMFTICDIIYSHIQAFLTPIFSWSEIKCWRPLKLHIPIFPTASWAMLVHPCYACTHILTEPFSRYALEWSIHHVLSYNSSSPLLNQQSTWRPFHLCYYLDKYMNSFLTNPA